MAQVIEILPQDKKNLPILQSQYDGCWWWGSLHRQGISNHDAAYAEL